MYSNFLSNIDEKLVYFTCVTVLVIGLVSSFVFLGVGSFSGSVLLGVLGLVDGVWYA